MRVALYARVSTERQERQGTIASQLDALRGFARDHQHDIVDSYVWLVTRGFNRARDVRQCQPFLACVPTIEMISA